MHKLSKASLINTLTVPRFKQPGDLSKLKLFDGNYHHRSSSSFLPSSVSLNFSLGLKQSWQALERLEQWQVLLAAQPAAVGMKLERPVALIQLQGHVTTSVHLYCISPWLLINFML